MENQIKSNVKFLKKMNINLNYGASNNLPISIDFPKEFNKNIIDKLNIDYKNIPKDKWFKY